MHISLTAEMEELIKDTVTGGMYTNASEVVRAALRKFFHLEDAGITYEEAARIRSIVLPRMEAIEDGSELLVDVDKAFDEAEVEVFGKRV